ncbi:MAG: hypothetical protein N2314_00235 [Brevinematales bacterium]|nr:hypothetical protein [Brevinematales bacterium]
MIQKLWLFGAIVALETLVIAILWFLATQTSLLYTILVILLSLFLLFWWRYTSWREKQKIYDQETLRKEQKHRLIFLTQITGGILLLTYIGFLIRVALG